MEIADREVLRGGDAHDAGLAEAGPRAVMRLDKGDASPRELAAVYRIVGFGESGLDEPDAVAAVLRLVADVVACERPLVFLYDGQAGEMHVHGPNGGRDRIESEPALVRRICSSGSAEIVNDVISDRDSDSLLTDTLGARQIVAVPLDAGSVRLGALTALNSKRGAFAESDLRLLELVAERASLTIQNARLRDKLDRQTQELTGLERLSRLLASAETVDYAVAQSVRIISDVVDCERTAILLYDEDSNTLEVRGPIAGMDDDEVEGLRISLAEPSLAGTVFRTDTALLSNDAGTDAWVGDTLRAAFGIDNLLVVPLTAGLRPMGVLVAVNARGGLFTDSDLRFATLLGTRIGGVIEASRARERERALLQRLREADRTKTEFVSMLAHELKGPMTTIKGFGEILRDQWDSMPESQRTKLFDIVSKEIDRLSRLVTDLLDVSRMEAGTLRYDMEPVDLGEVVANVLVVHSSLCARHTIRNELPDDLPDVMGDRDRIRQVLLNLLTNATRYAPEGSTVTIRASVCDGMVQTNVVDEGIGIGSGDLDRVFSKFVMLPKPGWVKKGTGLGLFITKGIVEAHGGRIWVESEPGNGSTFSFTLRPAP